MRSRQHSTPCVRQRLPRASSSARRSTAPRALLLADSGTHPADHLELDRQRREVHPQGRTGGRARRAGRFTPRNRRVRQRRWHQARVLGSFVSALHPGGWLDSPQPRRARARPGNQQALGRVAWRGNPRGEPWAWAGRNLQRELAFGGAGRTGPSGRSSDISSPSRTPRRARPARSPAALGRGRRSTRARSSRRFSKIRASRSRAPPTPS